MKKLFLPSVMASIILIGCGGGNGGSASLKEVKVIDSYIVGAKVCDNAGHCAVTDEKGVARARFDLNTTLTSIGGFIDSNFNGIQDSNELDAPFLSAPAGATVISPLTILVAKGADINKLSSLLGVTQDEILHTDPFETNNIKLVKVFNAIYPVIKENKIPQLVSKINNYNPSAPATDLPPMEAGVNVDIYYLAKSVLTKTEDRNFIDSVIRTDLTNARSLSIAIETLKQNLVNNGAMQTNVNNGVNETNNEAFNATNAVTSNVNNAAASNNSPLNNVNTNINTNTNPNNQSTQQSHPVYSTNTSGTDLPPMDEEYHPQSVPVAAHTDLPEIDSNNIELIPTTNNYNPSYTPLPRRYYIKLNSFDEFVELNKVNDKKYEFKNEKYFNVANADFNATKFFDINASYLFNDLNFAPDGNLVGSVFINLKDLNDSSEVNFTVKNVLFVVNNQKVISTDLRNVNIDINSTTANIQKRGVNAGNYNEFDINLSKVMSPYQEGEFNQTNHDYSFKIDYNVSNNVLTVLGKYGIVNAIVPTVNLDEDSYIVAKNSDINISVGQSNVANVGCSVDGVSLNCYVDNAGNIYLYGHTPDEEAIKVVTLTLDNQGYTNSKSLYLEILKPADNQIVHNWNLANSGYSGYHIEMNLTGNLANNIVDVNTSASPAVGSPENNVTVYLFNAKNDTNNYIRFIFDADVYHSNDVFVIKRGDNKQVKFRVGDIDISNNTFYFK